MNDTNQEPHQDRLGSFGHSVGARALPALDQPEWAATDESVVTAPIEFTYRWEEEFARRLDQLDVRWQYKPRTFAVEWDEDGNFVDSFTPDFYLPMLALYVELVPLDDRNFGAKARKVRLLRQQQPGIRVALLRTASLPYVLEPLFNS
jgi:hypothetical protein